MRYKLSIDRTVNRLVPHYLSGRRFILFVQSCLYPLQCTNERFRDFTKEMHIRARMTSQVIYFEWFLNYKFGKYIRDGKDRIRALADLVPCNNPHWRELFYRWFLSMTAHWQNIDRQHGNNTSPLLVGAQGYRKSTFCRILLPPELRFGYTDSIDFKSK